MKAPTTNLVVFGANGPTGRLVVAQALAAGHHVTAVTRKPDQYPLTSPHLVVAAADVTDPGGVDRVIASRPQAVISTYGVPYSRSGITVYSRGVTSIAAAMTRHGVHRLVCVTSTTVGTQTAPGASLIGRKVLLPLLRHVVGRTLYDDMQRMEEIVQDSGLEWTIVRPGGLFDTAEPMGDYEVGPPPHLGRVTSRADLADALIREAVEAWHPRATIEVITRSRNPSPPRSRARRSDSGVRSPDRRHACPARAARSTWRRRRADGAHEPACAGGAVRAGSYHSNDSRTAAREGRPWLQRAPCSAKARPPSPPCTCG